jgi:hypothetical protein
MAGTKVFIFEPEDLLMLWCHYTDGGVPLNGVIRNVGCNPMLQRFIGMEVESDEWDEASPLHLRYEGKRVMSWKKGQEENPWTDTPDTPSRQ